MLQALLERGDGAGGVAQGGAGDAHRKRRGGHRPAVVETPAEGQAGFSVLEGLVRASAPDQHLGVVPERHRLTLGVPEPARELECRAGLLQPLQRTAGEHGGRAPGSTAAITTRSRLPLSVKSLAARSNCSMPRR